MRCRLHLGTAAGVALLLCAAQVSAQRPTLWLDALLSSARPPAEVVDRTTGVYALFGGRADWEGRQHSFDAGAYLGLGTKAEDGRWGTLTAAAERSWTWGRTSGSVHVDLLGLHYADPFQYTAGALTLQPALAHQMGRASAKLFVEGTVGGWSSSVQVPLADTVIQADSSGPLRSAGLGGQLIVPVSSGAFTIKARVADAVNGARDGTFAGVTGELAQRLAGWDISGELSALSGPGFSDTGAALRAGRALGSSVYVSAEFARVVTDPLFGSRGYTGATVSVSWRPGPRAPDPAAQRVAVIGSRESDGRRVEFRLKGVTAQRAELVGSFTNWQPKAMVRRQGEWWLQVTLPLGTHQFAFLLDGETWYLPKDAPGVVDDGFGRRNATLIIARL